MRPMLGAASKLMRSAPHLTSDGCELTLLVIRDVDVTDDHPVVENEYADLRHEPAPRLCRSAAEEATADRHLCAHDATHRAFALAPPVTSIASSKARAWRSRWRAYCGARSPPV